MAEEGDVLEVNVMAAEDLKDVSIIGKMKPYVVAWMDHDPSRKCCTRSCNEGGKHPYWNQILKLPISHQSLLRGTGFLHIHIYSKGPLSSTPIGSVQIPVAQFSFLATCHRARDVEFFSKEVSRPSGKVQGTLHFAVRLENARNDQGAHIIRTNTFGGHLRRRAGGIPTGGALLQNDELASSIEEETGQEEMFYRGYWPGGLQLDMGAHSTDDFGLSMVEDVAIRQSRSPVTVAEGYPAVVCGIPACSFASHERAQVVSWSVPLISTGLQRNNNTHQ